MPIFPRKRWTRKPPHGTPIDWSNPLNAGLVGCWAFGESAGPPVEAITGLPFAMSGTTTWGSGPYGTSLQSDGSSGYGVASFPALDGLFAFSVCLLWSDRAGDGAYTRIVEYGANNGWSFDTNDDFQANKVRFYSVGAGAAIYSSATICDGTWHVLHGTNNNITTKLYVDGTLNSTSAGGSGYGPAASNLSLFRYGGGGFISTSKVAGLWAWNRVLGAAEVAAHAANPWQVFRPRRSLIPLGPSAAVAFSCPPRTLVSSSPPHLAQIEE